MSNLSFSLVMATFIALPLGYLLGTNDEKKRQKAVSDKQMNESVAVGNSYSK